MPWSSSMQHLEVLGLLSHQVCSTHAYRASNEAPDRLLVPLLAAHGIPIALEILHSDHSENCVSKVSYNPGISSWNSSSP